MKKFRVLFHVIPPFWAGLWYGIRHPVSGGIALATWSRITHCEIWTPFRNNSGVGIWDLSPYPYKDIPYTGTCWTSTLRGKYDGACKRPARVVLKNPNRWRYREYECSDEDYNNMIAAMDKAVKENKGYDISLILRFLAFVPVFNKRKYVCSEFCQMALIAVKDGYMLDYADRSNKPLSPKALAAILPGKMKKLT